MKCRWFNNKNFNLVIIWLLFGMVFPNALFWIVGIMTHTMRPWLNLDYVWVALLFCLPRWWKLLAVLALFGAFMADSLLLVNQLFPIDSFTGAMHLLPLVFTGPKQYQCLLLLAIVWLLIILVINCCQSNHTISKWRMVLGLMILCLGFIVSAVGDSTFIQSQLIRYYQGSYNNFIMEGNPDARRADSGSKSLSLQLIPKSNSQKILLIMDESWGFTKNPQLQQAVLQSLLTHRGQFAYFEQGMKRFNGLTLQAELKELCQLQLKSVATDGLTTADFADCLPHLMQQRGYVTYGIHGSTGSYYQRADWYPKAGFQYRQFLENMPQLPRCGAFRGVCDGALFAEVKKMLFAQPKSFVHWMTLTTHFPYETKDITDQRLQCSRFGLENNSTSCRNLMLHAQFFDQLTQWLQDPELKGLEVVVIGDHEPPIFDLAAQSKNFQPAGVSWLHFKVQ